MEDCRANAMISELHQLNQMLLQRNLNLVSELAASQAECASLKEIKPEDSPKEPT